MKTLLRYPGGKSRAVKQIIEYFPKGLSEMCSPFFGGGAIELEMASKGVNVYGYDNFISLVAFWVNAISKNKELSELVSSLYPVTKKEFKDYQIALSQNNTSEDIYTAALFYVVNRCSFSGTTLSGGMSHNHPRFTKTSIERLEKFNVGGLSVRFSDFEHSINKHSEMFKYCDPPYIIESNLYGVKGDKHKNFEHQRLFEVLDSCNNWILSYNDCEWVRKTYKDYKIVELNFAYGMSKSKTELLIINT